MYHENSTLRNNAIEFDDRDLNDYFEAAATGLRTWISRSRTRRALAMLDAHMLEDIGVSEEARRAEVKKFFWEA